MKKRMRPCVRAAIAILMIGFPMPVGAQANAPAKTPPSVEPASVNPAVAAFDVMIVRPLGLLVLPVGVAAFIPAALLTAPSGMDTLQEALELFVISPAEYVFTRPLGDF
jgi:hypothetical protein